MTKENNFKISLNGVAFEGNYRQAMNFLVANQYDTSYEGLNKKLGNDKGC